MTKNSIWQRIEGDDAPISGSILFACLLGAITVWLTGGQVGPTIATLGFVAILITIAANVQTHFPLLLTNLLAVSGLGLVVFSHPPLGGAVCAILWPVLGSLAGGHKWQAGLVASLCSLVALVLLGPFAGAGFADAGEHGAQTSIFALGVCGALALAAGLKAQRAHQNIQALHLTRVLPQADPQPDAESALNAALQARDLAQADAQAARKETQQRALFMAEMSHEIRTPLNAILGFADTMREGVLGPMPPVYRDYPALIHSSGTHLLDLVSDMLDLSKVEAGRFETKLKPLRLDEIAQEGVRLSGGAARSAGVQIRHEASGPIAVQGDARALRQIVFNLLSNAIKFTPQDGRVSVRTGVDSQIQMAFLEVEDTGVGMSAADLARIGEPWTQVGAQDDTGTKRPRGSGLGLALVKRLAELQGGRFSMTSTQGLGSVARITLPLVQATPDPKAANSTFTDAV
ncbi:MAG: hypothetical protein RLZZ157_229 [Pseudomonadota bacterium]